MFQFTFCLSTVLFKNATILPLTCSDHLFGFLIYCCHNKSVTKLIFHTFFAIIIFTHIVVYYRTYEESQWKGNPIFLTSSLLALAHFHPPHLLPPLYLFPFLLTIISSSVLEFSYIPKGVRFLLLCVLLSWGGCPQINIFKDFSANKRFSTGFQNLL